MTYANGVCTKKSCPSGKQLNEGNCLCESTCTPSKSEWVSAESSVKDTCNGNAVDEYACFSGEEKTCVDVRTTTTTIDGGSRPCNDGECLQWSGDKCLVVCGHYDITAPTINPGGSSSGPGQLQDTIIGGGNVGWSGGTIAYKEKRTVTCCGFKTAWKPGIGGDIQFVPIK